MVYSLEGFQRMRDTFDHLNETVCVRVPEGDTVPRLFNSQADTKMDTDGSEPREKRYINPDPSGGAANQWTIDAFGEVPLLSRIFKNIRRGKCHLVAFFNILADSMKTIYRYITPTGSGTVEVRINNVHPGMLFPQSEACCLLSTARCLK